MSDTIFVAWCPVCECDKLPHDRFGSCLFCDKVIEANGKALYSREPKKRATYQRRTAESVVEELQALAVRVGRPPKVQDDTPLAQSAKRYHGSWANAVEAAGFPCPSRQSRYRRAA